MLKRYSPILDQFFVSAGNFVITVILARQLDEELFGVYSILWLIIISVAAIFQSLLIAPLFSICPKLSGRECERFLTLVLAELLLILISISTVLLMFILVSIYFKHDFFSAEIVYFMVLAIPYFLYDYLRRRLMVLGKNVVLLLVDFFCYLSIILGLILLLNGVLFEAVAVISVVFTVSSIFILSIIGLNFEVLKKSPMKCSYLLKKQWEFSRWLLGSSALQFINGNALTLISGAIISISQVGYIRMAQNIVGMINPIYLFLDNHAQLYLARLMHREGIVSCEQSYRRIAKVCIIGLVLVLSFIFVFREQILSLLYGNQKEILLDYLVLMLVVSFATGLNFLERLLAKVQGNTKVIFRSYVYSSVITCLVIYPLSYKFGGSGTIIAMLVAQSVMLTVVYLSRHLKKI